MTGAGKAIWEPVFDGAASTEDLILPMTWPIGRTIEVCPLADLFSGCVPDPIIDQIYAVMSLCPHHTFEIVTSNLDRMSTYLTTPHRPDTDQFITILDDGSMIKTPGAHIRANSAMCDLFKFAPAEALDAACAWQDERFPDGDGFMRQWPLPNVRSSL